MVKIYSGIIRKASKYKHLVLLQLYGFLLLPAIILAQTPVFNSEFSENLVSPYRMAVDNNDFLYVTDATQKVIIKFDTLGNFLESIDPGFTPACLAINGNNEMFVGDAESGKVFKLGSNGEASEFYSGTVLPNAMTFDNNNLLYVSDSKLKKVVVIDSAGNLIRMIGGTSLTYPTGVAFDSKNNRILIAEHGGIGTGFNPVEKVWIFGLTGNLIGSFGSHGITDGKFYRIQGVVVGRCGNIYVNDPYLSRVSIFTETKAFLSKFGTYGDGSGEMNMPMDIVIDSKDRLYITSLNNGKVQVYNINFILPTSDIRIDKKNICSGDTAKIPVYFTGTAPWTFTIALDGVNKETVVDNYANPYIIKTVDAGSYSITSVSDAVTSGTCFSGVAEVVVTTASPAADITTSNLSVCNGESALVHIELSGSSPWSFTYTRNGLDPQMIKNISSSSFDLAVSEAGVYEITNVVGGACSSTNASGSATVVLNSKPTALFTNGNNNVTVCAGDTAFIPVSLSGTPPWSLTYSLDERDYFTIDNITSSPCFIPLYLYGTYEINAVADAHCSNESFMGWMDIYVTSTPVSVITTNNILINTGDTASIVIELEGKSPWSFTYTKDGMDPVDVGGITQEPYVLKVTQAGVYEIVSLTGNGCTGSSFNGTASVEVIPKMLTWTGLTSTDWSVGANWSTDYPPGPADDVVISSVPYYQPHITSLPVSSAFCNNLTVDPGAKVIIDAGKALTASGTITNNGLFIIESDATGTGSFIDNGTVLGDIIVKKFLDGNRWWYLGSPISNATGDAFGTLSSVTNTGNRLFFWEEPLHAYTNVSNTTDAIPALRGNAFKRYDASPVTASFSGTANTGVIGATDNLSFTIGVYAGYNLVCNPYPSAIDWGSMASPTPGLIQTNLETSIWYRSSGTYATYNWTTGIGANGGQQYIPAMQAFWVCTSGSTCGLQLSNSTRLHSGQPFYKETNENNILRMLISDGQNTDEAVIAFFADAGTGDDAFDSKKMLVSDEDIPQLFSLTSENTAVAINGQNEIFAGDERAIPLAYNTAIAGTYTLQASNIEDFDQFINVYLEDVQLNYIQDLRLNEIYSFASGEGNYSSRFILHFGSMLSGIDTENENIPFVYCANNVIYINTDANAVYEIYNIIGEKISQGVTEKGLNKIEVNASRGVYSIRIVTDSRIFSKSILL